ncbi:MAG: DUF1631 family protein [Candidatus Endonucleobacter bathymodioli]|uniref:DUF1631 family protein n=1 Tax=Candidatus Endonucleibacter bathymodioli TaxID=539814 RepID=A0AA90NSZ9_9GAMM|nr:DUF1631 family protein [Candidatus Endonucleobacter bathymodioli]
MSPLNNILGVSQENSTQKMNLSLHPFFLELLEKYIHPMIYLVIEEAFDYLLHENTYDNEKSLDLINTFSNLSQEKENIWKRFTFLLNKHYEELNTKDLLISMNNHAVETNTMKQAISETLVSGEISKRLEDISSRTLGADDIIPLISSGDIYSSFKKAISELMLSIELEETIINMFRASLQNHMFSMREEADEFLKATVYDMTEETPSEYKNHKEITSSMPEASETTLLAHITNPALEKTTESISDRISLKVTPTVTYVSTLTTMEPDETFTDVQSDLLKHTELPEYLNKHIKEILLSKDSNKKLSRQHNNNENMLCFLQIQILSLSFLDQNFLLDQQHPARTLLNKIAYASTNHGDSKPTNNNISLLIEETMTTIITSFHDSDISNCSLKDFRAALENICPQQYDQYYDKGNSDPLCENNNEELVNTHDSKPTFHSIKASTDTNMEFSEEIVLKNKSISNINAFTESCQLKNNEKQTQPIENLSIGQWVEFVGAYSKKLRCQLTHIDHIHDSYIFTNSSGLKVVEKSGQKINESLEKGVINILDETQGLDKKLHNIINRLLDF